MAPRKKQEETIKVLELEPEAFEEMVEADEEMLDQDDDLMVDEDGNELLFPGGPTLNKVEEWKSQHGEIFLTEFDDDVFLWKTLSRKEYKNVMKAQGADQFYREERICDECIIYPDKYDFIAMSRGKAGIPTLLSELIMEKSGFQAKTGAMKL